MQNHPPRSDVARQRFRLRSTAVFYVGVRLRPAGGSAPKIRTHLLLWLYTRCQTVSQSAERPPVCCSVWGERPAEPCLLTRCCLGSVNEPLFAGLSAEEPECVYVTQATC